MIPLIENYELPLHSALPVFIRESLPYAGNQMMMSPDEEDLEQLIKGGPFELGLYADKLGSHMFGIDSVAQVGVVWHTPIHCLPLTPPTPTIPFTPQPLQPPRLTLTFALFKPPHTSCPFTVHVPFPDPLTPTPILAPYSFLTPPTSTLFLPPYPYLSFAPCPTANLTP